MPSLQKTDGFGESGILIQGNGHPPFAQPAGEQLTDEETNQLLSLTVLSLSAFRINHCRLVVIRDPELKKRLHKFILPGLPPSLPASLVILCMELHPQEKGQAREAENHTRSKPPAHAGPRIQNPRERDEAMLNCGIAAQTLILTAKAMGFECQRLTGVDPAGLGPFINLPENYAAAMLLMVGKHIKPVDHHPASCPFSNLVVIDQF
ncbi:MAG: nitroreductase family protein [Desulfobaccales bacterium]